MVPLRPLLHVAAAAAVLAGTLGSLVVRGAFALRHDYVAEHLCESRHDPGSDCDGRCVLKERMEAVGAHHGDEAPAAVPAPPVLLAVAAPRATVPPDRWRTLEAGVPGPAARAASEEPGGVFRPPRRA